MQYTRLGQTGLVVSRLAFGAMTFSGGNRDIASVYKVGSHLADELVGAALDAGINRLSGFDVLPTNKELGFALVEQMRVIAQKYDASVAQVAIAWLLSKRAVTSVLIGSTKRSQLDDNLKAVNLQLTPDELA